MSDDTRPCDVEDDGFVTVYPPLGPMSEGTVKIPAGYSRPKPRTHTEKFDASIARVTDDRGKDYGPPGEDFAEPTVFRHLNHQGFVDLSARHQTLGDEVVSDPQGQLRIVARIL